MNNLDVEIKGLQIAMDILADALKKRNRLATELQKARERRENAYPHNSTTVAVSFDPRPYPCAEVEE